MENRGQKMQDIKCYRQNGRAVVEGVEHKIVYHSLDGFEWGYGGSGPAELALNILAQYLPNDAAYRLHQDFKWKFIAPLSEEGGTIKRTDIEAWIANKNHTPNDDPVIMESWL